MQENVSEFCGHHVHDMLPCPIVLLDVGSDDELIVDGDFHKNLCIGAQYEPGDGNTI